VSEEKKAVSDSLNQKPVEPEPMDSPGAKIRINHRQHPRAKRLTGSKQKLTELGLIAHTTISKAFPLLCCGQYHPNGSTNGYRERSNPD